MKGKKHWHPRLTETVQAPQLGLIPTLGDGQLREPRRDLAQNPSIEQQTTRGEPKPPKICLSVDSLDCVTRLSSCNPGAG